MKRVAQDYRDFINEQTCVYSRLQVTADNGNISSPEEKEKNTSLTKMAQSDCPCLPGHFIYCGECVCSRWLFR